MVEDLRIQTKIYQLMQWLLPKLERFPKVYRNTISQRVMDNALDLSELINLTIAHKGNTRQRFLQQADARLYNLRMYLRLITEWHWLNISQYEHVSTLVRDIGRMAEISLNTHCGMNGSGRS